METRLEAMRRAVETVRVPLETFYGSLSDDQKVQFDAMKPEPQVTRSASRNRRTVVSPAQVCRAQTLGVERVEGVDLRLFSRARTWLTTSVSSPRAW